MRGEPARAVAAGGGLAAGDRSRGARRDRRARARLTRGGRECPAVDGVPGDMTPIDLDARLHLLRPPRRLGARLRLLRRRTSGSASPARSSMAGEHRGARRRRPLHRDRPRAVGRARGRGRRWTTCSSATSASRCSSPSASTPPTAPSRSGAATSTSGRPGRSSRSGSRGRPARGRRALRGRVGAGPGRRSGRGGGGRQEPQRGGPALPVGLAVDQDQARRDGGDPHREQERADLDAGDEHEQVDHAPCVPDLRLFMPPIPVGRAATGGHHGFDWEARAAAATLEA